MMCGLRNLQVGKGAVARMRLRKAQRAPAQVERHTTQYAVSCCLVCFVLLRGSYDWESSAYDPRINTKQHETAPNESATCLLYQSTTVRLLAWRPRCSWKLTVKPLTFPSHGNIVPPSSKKAEFSAVSAPSHCG